MFLVTNATPNYTSPLIGNGEITTTLGPTGYHNGTCPEREAVNRTIFWAGRRLNTPTHALVRFGQLARRLSINNELTQDDDWEQRVDYDQGRIVSRLNHGDIVEETCSQVCYTANVLVFQTTLENRSDTAAQLDMSWTYQLATTVDPQLFFPAMSHFDFRPGYQPLDNDDAASQIRTRVQPPDDNDNLRVFYQINDQLGEVRLGWSYRALVQETPDGGIIRWAGHLGGGERVELLTWVMLSDRQHYTHFPNVDRIGALLQEHRQAWSDFWQTSTVELGNESLEALRKTSLYAIRCSASPWSVPPAYLATHWEGRTFHDELYPFLGLISSGHDALASRIPGFRLGTLPVALARSGYQGASFPWETLENGEEGGPYGHWLDERFHIGQFAVTAWQYYLYTRDADDLSRFYPLLRGCAERFVQDVLIRDEAGRLSTRPVTDFDEMVYPLANGIFTLCAAVRSMEIAAQAAEILNVDTAMRDRWQQLSTELRRALPVNVEEQYYKVSDDSQHWHIAQLGTVYPFSIDLQSELAHETLSRLADQLRTDVNATAGSPAGYAGSHWLWATSLLATAFFYQGRAEEGFDLLRQATNSIGPFFAPNEQKVTRNGDTDFVLPWFTTSAGAFVYALNSMIVHVVEGGTILFHGVPTSMPAMRFRDLMGAAGVRVSGQIENGIIKRLSVRTTHAMQWKVFMPAHWASNTVFSALCTAPAPAQHGLQALVCDLQAGENELIAL